MICVFLIAAIVQVGLADTCFWNAGTPEGVPTDFDCASRVLAWEYGKQLLPQRGGFQSLFDALQLQCCNETRPKSSDDWVPPSYETPTSGNVYFVDASTGNDGNPGTSAKPVRTIGAGVKLARGKGGATVVVRAGVYEETVSLDEADSGLVLQNEEGAHVVVSGGDRFEIEKEMWSLWDGGVKVNAVDGANNIYGRVPSPKASAGDVVFIGVMNSTEECEQAVVHAGGDFGSFTYHRPNFSSDFASHCFGVVGGRWTPTPETNVVSGVIQRKNVWSAPIPKALAAFWANSPGAPGLRVNGGRGVAGKFPNLDPEQSGSWYLVTDPAMGGGQYERGWETVDTEWIAPELKSTTDIVVNAAFWPGVEWPMTEGGSSRWTGEGSWGDFHIGVGGYCQDKLDPPTGYWCAGNPPRGNCWGCGAVQTFMAPTGMIATSMALPNGPYTNTSDMEIFAWRGGGRWYTWTFLGSGDASNGSLIEFNETVGGNQGGEGEIRASQWYVSNVKEEVDTAGEFFLDTDNAVLFYQFNDTPTGNESWSITMRSTLFNLTGSSSSSPIRDVVIRGLEIRDARSSYFAKHAMPSGGDWALVKNGAVTIANAVNVTIDNSLFERNDGNCIFLGHRTRNVTVSNSEFAWTGATAIAAFGDGSECFDANCTISYPAYKAGPDLRHGNQPRDTLLSGNYFREIGVFQKQSSAYFQAIAHSNIIGNVITNGPRAGINFNDGGIGGDVITNNLLLNQVRESGDHAAINLWNRLPMITVNPATNISTIIPATRTFSRNLILGLYAAQDAVDSDDGTAFINVTQNVFTTSATGGKSDFGGRQVHHYNNLYAYIQDCFQGITDTDGTGTADSFHNNKCILRVPSGGYSSDCNLAPNATVFNNSIYNPTGAIQVCGGIPLQQWVEKGHDPGSTIQQIPPTPQIIQWARHILQL